MTHPVFLQHLRVSVCQMLAALDVVDTLNTVALLEVRLHYAGFHGAYPRLPDVVLLLLLLSYRKSFNGYVF